MFRFVCGEAVYADDFLAGFFALEKCHGAFGQAEFFGEEETEFFVGAAFEGGGVDFDFEGVTEPARDGGAWSVGNRFDGERATAGGGVAHAGRERCRLWPVEASPPDPVPRPGGAAYWLSGDGPGGAVREPFTA